MSTSPAIIAFTVDDLSEEEATTLKEKLGAIVDGVRYRRLPVADIQVQVLRPDSEDLVFVWGENIDADDVRSLKGLLQDLSPDGKFVVSNFEPGVESLNPEEVAQFVRSLQEEDPGAPATRAEQDALESLRVSAHQHTKFLRAGWQVGPLATDSEGAARLVVEDLDPGGHASLWRVSFRVGDVEVWGTDASTLQGAAEVAALFVTSVERAASAASWGLPTR